MSTLSQIQAETATLPHHVQAEVLDFVQFVKQRHASPRVMPSPTDATADEGDSPLFRALTEAGFVGCIDTNEQLSTHYKDHLDFSAKVGVQR